MPARIQRKRTPGWSLAGATTNPLGAVIVDRTGRFGNPFRILDGLVVEHPDGDRLWSCSSETAARKCASDLYAQWLGGVGPDVYRVNGRAFDRCRVLAAVAAGVLTGRDLACTCPPPGPGEPDHCHGVVLMRRAERPLTAPA
jgi:hypothetical protein